MRLRKLDAAPEVVPAIAPGEPARQAAVRRRNWYRWTVVAVLGLAGAGAALYAYWRSYWLLTTGRVMAVEVHIASPLVGRVAEVPAKEGDRVEAGQVVARLDDRGLKADVAWAEVRWEAASAAAARAPGAPEAGEAAFEPAPEAAGMPDTLERDAELTRRRAARAEAAAKQARALEGFAREGRERQERLVLLQAATRDALLKAQAEERKAAAAAEAAEAERDEAAAEAAWAARRLEQRKASPPPGAAAREQQARDREVRERADAQREIRRRDDEEKRLRAEQDRAAADLEMARLRQAQAAIAAPRGGVVSWVGKKAGEVVDPNDVILTIMDPRGMWIEAYVSASDMADIREGVEAEVRFDGVLPEPVKGRVSLWHPPPGTGVRVDTEVRVPAHLARLLHPVKIVFPQGLPPQVHPEMIARVSIRRP